MVKLRHIAKWIEEAAPVALAETWDHVGLQIGDMDADITRIVTCLSVTPAVVAEALEQKADCIVSHHPLLFHPIRSIDFSTPLGDLVQAICAARLNVYSCHTNYDKAARGLNYHLAQLLKLKDTTPLDWQPGLGEEVGLGRVGAPSAAMGWDAYLHFVCEKLGTDSVRIVSGTARTRLSGPVRVAVCGGSGGSLIKKAAQAADLYITGDLDYHDALYAQDLGLEVWDFGHFFTEIGAAKWLAELIRSNAAEAEAELEAVVATSEMNPFTPVSVV